MTDTTSLRDAARIALEALERQQAWHESEKKAISKSGRRDTGTLWRDCQHREELDALDNPVKALRSALALPDEPVAPKDNQMQAIIAGALFDLMGFLTVRDARITLSGRDDAAPAVEALEAWAKDRGFDITEADVTGWQARAAQPAPVEPAKPLTHKQLAEYWVSINDPLFMQNRTEALVRFARAIEAAHGIKPD